MRYVQESLNDSLHTFAINVNYAHDDERNAEVSPSTVASVMKNANENAPYVVTVHQLVRSFEATLEPHCFKKETTLLSTSFCCDEVNRDLEDESRSIYGLLCFDISPC